MEELLAAALLADAGVKAIVRSRVNWLARPKASALPALVLQVISSQPTYTFTARDGLTIYRIQIDCWATQYLAAKQLARAVFACLDTLTAAPFARPEVIAERDFFDAGDAPQAGDDPSSDLYRTSLDVRLAYRPAA